ncbi:MAG: hypothetical protein V2I26_19970 [Halieaceae bacterium]|jgi:hypothetical protein|nr:hypothetical protein [Halieaceae bacterium]
MTRQALAHGALALLLACSLVYLHSAETAGASGAAFYLAGAWAFLCGLALSHIVHEWGHFLGAVVARSALTIKPRVHPLFFDFDYLANRPPQFLALSLGGLLGNLVLLAALLATGAHSLVLTGLLAAVIGQFVYVLVLELPVSLGVMAGRDPLETLATHFGQGRPLFLRATLAGIAAAVLVFLLSHPGA